MLWLDGLVLLFRRAEYKSRILDSLIILYYGNFLQDYLFLRRHLIFGDFVEPYIVALISKIRIFVLATFQDSDLKTFFYRENNITELYYGILVLSAAPIRVQNDFFFNG